MKIAIIGAGAMGCLYGSLLAAENELTMIDVSVEGIRTINRDGICVESRGELTYSPAAGCISGECRQEMDLVIIFVKTIFSVDALTMNRDIIGDHTVLISLQNGAGNDRILKQFVPESQIVIGNSEHNSVLKGPGRISHSGSGVTRIGSPVGNREAVETVYEAFSKAGIRTSCIDNIQEIIWKKLMVNLAFNPLTAILDIPIGGARGSESCRSLQRMLLEEALTVAEADGTPLDHHKVFTEIERIAETLGSGYTSMHQDLSNGRRTEIDQINGAVVKQAELLGVDAPYNRMITSLIKAKEWANHELPAGAA
jgi:2-dehydropantoate 2-reductase